MKLRNFLASIVLGSLMFLAACSTSVPLRNVQDQPIPRSLTTHQVVRAIQVAAHQKGWHTTQVRPGLIYATINIRSHVAQVKIPYNRQGYSIVYKHSSKLNYDGHSIHRNYNRWVANLNKYIQKNLDAEQLGRKLK